MRTTKANVTEEHKQLAATILGMGRPFTVVTLREVTAPADPLAFIARAGRFLRHLELAHILENTTPDKSKRVVYRVLDQAALRLVAAGGLEALPRNGNGNGNGAQPDLAPADRTDALVEAMRTADASFRRLEAKVDRLLAELGVQA